MKLEAITRGNGDARGKPRVFLTCHPLDVDVAIPLVSGDLLRHANCAVWYDAEPDVPADMDELLDCLDEMQLIVLAVTSRFLYMENRARDTELKFALERHIPVLPILLESGLSREFNRVTDTKLQVVYRHVSDPTATPYDEVLDTYLKSVLVGDALAEKVRNAFDAYVFLSYRKKDRRQAQRLMRLIHENRQFRDIAIWYDEFLVPGEQYTDAIRDAFEKSRLFALAVTPSLLEPENYVMRVEYPMARRRRRKQHDLAILPVDLSDEGPDGGRTDRKQLKQAYKGIPPVHEAAQMNEALLRVLVRVGRKKTDGSPRHRFFIGLAYLCGIDVEINHERALEMITSAATDRNPCFEATEKLVDMYLNGDGVARCEQTALEWQKRLVEQYRADYLKGHSPDEHRGFGTRTFRALTRLSDMQRELCLRPEAIATAKEALRLGGELMDEVGVREVERDIAVVCNRLGGLYRIGGRLEDAEACYARSRAIYERLAREMGTARARRDLSVSLERMGDMCRRRRDLDGAEALYARARALREDMNDGASPSARRDLSAILTKIGDVRKKRLDFDGAARAFEQALEIDRVLAEEMRTWQAWDDCAVSLVKLGDVYRSRMRTRDAVDLQLRALEILERNARETGSIQYRKNLASGLEKLAKSWDAFYRRDEARQCYERAARLREDLMHEYPSHTTRHELATTYFLFADFDRNADMMRAALTLWEEMLHDHPEYGRYADSARRMMGKLE